MLALFRKRQYQASISGASQQFVSALARNLAHSHRCVREASLGLLCCHHSFGKYDELMGLFQKISSMPISLQTEREIKLLVQKVKLFLDRESKPQKGNQALSGGVEQTFIKLVLHFFCGMLHIKFKLLWDTLVDVLSYLLNSQTFGKECLPPFIRHLAYYNLKLYRREVLQQKPAAQQGGSSFWPRPNPGAAEGHEAAASRFHAIFCMDNSSEDQSLDDNIIYENLFAALVAAAGCCQRH